MYLADSWLDYEIIDAGGGEKLERWGDVTLLRPDPQAVWPMGRGNSKPDAHYIRSSSGGGHWEYNASLAESWTIRWRELTFLVRPTGFKHTGLFPEQAVNWAWMQDIIRNAKLKSGEKPRRAKPFCIYRRRNVRTGKRGRGGGSCGRGEGHGRLGKG